MPRQVRLKGENLTHHIVQRGNERKNIFYSDEDRRKYLQILRDKIEEEEFRLYGYCLMDNHVHILLKAYTGDISQLMKRINVSYVMYFNKKYGRYGHLFQNRFKSQMVDTDAYLLQVSKYIHRNPIKAKIVANADMYKWSSYNIYIGTTKDSLGIIDRYTILKMLDKDQHIAIERYKKFVQVEDVMNVDYRRFMDLELEEEARTLDEKIADTIIKEKHLNKDETIRAIKKRTQLTIKEIGEKMAISASTVSRILRK